MLTSLRQGYYLGIDGGGTKTEAVVANESGFVLGRGAAGGANPHNLPMDVAYENITQAALQAITQAQQKDKQVDAFHLGGVCLGLAGIDTASDRKKVSEYITQVSKGQARFVGQQMVLCNDGFVGLKSATDDNWGVCMISSTGSNVYGVNQLGNEATAGDWGYLLGDQGSGFALGLKLIQKVIREHDGRKPQTKLTNLVLEHLKLNQAVDLIPWAYGGQVPVRDIASLSQILNHSELEYSPDVWEVVGATIRELVEAYLAVVRRLEISDKVFNLVLIGGLFNLKFPLKERVKHAILEVTPQVRVMTPSRSPAEGAVRVAQMSNLKKLFPDSVITVIK